MMRRILYAQTFERDLRGLLDFGVERFGRHVAEQKVALMLDAIEQRLVEYPGLGRPVQGLDLLSYHVTRTPFVLLYSHTDEELRIYTVVHARSNIPGTDVTRVEW